MLRTLCSRAKYNNLAATKDCCQLSKDRVYIAEDVVHLREERERLDRENVTKGKIHQEKAAAKVVSSREGSKSSKHVETKIIGTKQAPDIELSDSDNAEDNILCGVGWDEKENGEEEDSVVYIGDMLDLEDAMKYGKGREGVSSLPPVVTRSGRVVETGHLGQ